MLADFPLRTRFLPLFLFLLAVSARAAEAVVTGSVSNAATGNLLEGARVEVPALGRVAFTDGTGRYVLTGLPAGEHALVVTYLGLDAARASVTAAAGARVERNFDLTTAIYRLDAFKVTGEREGDAAALTLQRNAENVKNVVAMDSFGNLPNLSAGEVVMRLPGVAGSPTDEGLAYWFNIRGMDPQLNSVTIDGGGLPSVNLNRTFQLQSVTGTMFEALELTKGHTPDKGADSLGGTINLKTRSPLSMREPRRTTYSLTARVAPSFFEQTPTREQHRAHPLATLAHQQLFDVFGGQRNLGVALNLFYSENAVGGASTTLDYQNTLNPEAYVWDFRQWDNINNRKQTSANLRADYRWSPETRFSVTLLANDNFERHRRRMEVRAFTGNANTVPNATTTGVVPGLFNGRVTVVRPVAAANLDVLMDGPLNFYVRTRKVDLGAEHEFGRWQIDYTGGIGYTNLNTGQGTAGALTMRLAGAGWILERTDDPMYPRLLANGGPDFLNPDNYRPTANGLTNTNNQIDRLMTQARANARYELPVAVPLFLKAGLSWREEEFDAWGRDNHRWSYIGGGPLAPDPALLGHYARGTGLRLPRWQSHMFMNNRRPRDPAAWREDLYYHESQKFTATRGYVERAQAVYGMAQGRLGREGWAGRTGFLGGVRWERTENEADGWVRARALSTAAQQAADPAGAAQRDYAGNRRELAGGYTKAFPSVHAWHDWTANLKTRLAWSTSFGRPPFGNLAPAETPNENERTVTVSNPALLPQVARNWDATLEYYFEPVGSISAGWFHKRIRDYIVPGIVSGTVGSGADNGFNGEYAGFTLLRSANAGTATVQGWEFSYQQQFSFLPGWLRGFSGMANYSVLTAAGDFGGRAGLSSNQVAGFIPRMGNASLSWRRGGFSTRVLFTYTGDYITSYAAGSAGRNIYRRERRLWNWGCAYQFRPSFGVTLDVDNLTNAPQSLYRGIPDQIQLHSLHGTTVSVGLNGRF